MNNRKKKYGIVCIVVLIVLAIGIVFYIRPDAGFYIRNTFYQLSHEVKISEYEKIKLMEYSVGELQDNKDITWNDSLLLVNSQNTVNEDELGVIEEYGDSGVMLNQCAVESFQQLQAKVKELNDQTLFVKSSYRSYEEQVKTYEEYTSVAAIPGTSEHQLGLALDLYVKGFGGYGFLKTEEGQYVNMNCWKYGFIIRYPYGKYQSTGITYEPWHVRYVGIPHAEAIYKNSLSLEQYIEELKIGKFYKITDYIVSRQSGETLEIANEITNVVISPDNMGNYIITGKLKE